MTNNKRENETDEAIEYALDALTASEQADLENRLAGSEHLRNEVTSMTETAALLGLAVEPVSPPPGLKASIMAGIASTPQLPREATNLRAVDAAPAGPTALESKVRARWYSRPAVFLTAAAAAVALIFGGGVVANVLNDSRVQQQQADQLAAINAADDMQQAAAAVSTGGTATLVWSGELGLSALIVEGLPALPSDSDYELWYIRADGTPVSAGLLDVTGERTWRVLDGEMHSGDTVGVTIEPRGGSGGQPTTSPIVAIASA